MGTAWCLVLGWSGAVVPQLVVQITQVEVECLGKEGAGTDRTVRTVTCFFLSVTLVKDEAKSQVELFKGSIVDILYDAIKERTKVEKTFFASVYIV